MSEAFLCEALGANSAFEAVSPLPESTVCAIATMDLGSVRSVSITTVDRESGLFQMAYDGTGFDDQYTINFRHRHIGQGNMHSRLGNRRTGRRMFANRMLVGLALGMDEVLATASRDMGGYVWARAGLYVEAEGAMELSQQLFTRAGFITSELDGYASDRLMHLCNLSEPQALKALADLDDPVDGGYLFDLALQATTQAGFYTADMYRNKGYFKDGQTLGHFMLCGLSYPAYLSLRDLAQMDTVEDYTGTPVRDLHARRITPPTQSAGYWLNPPSRTARPQ